MKSFPMYVATMVALKAARSARAQLRFPARGLAPAYADPQRAAEERWDGEGGSRSAAVRRDPLEL